MKVDKEYNHPVYFLFYNYFKGKRYIKKRIDLSGFFPSGKIK